MINIIRIFYILGISFICLTCIHHIALGQSNKTIIGPLTKISLNAQQIDLIQKYKEEKRILSSWEWCLRQIAKKENATMFFDVPDNLYPPNIDYTTSCGIRAMKAISTVAKRSWIQINGVQTFSRTEVKKDSEQISSALTWLTGMSQRNLRDLLQGKTCLDQLDEDKRDMVSNLGAWEPDMAFVLLDKPTQVHLAISPKFEYKDPKTGSVKSVEIPCRPADPPANLLKRIMPGIENLDKPELGKLNFTKGEVLTLSEIIIKAEKVFGVAYSVDNRIADNHYFIEGTFTQTTFENILEKIATVPPVRINTYKKPDRQSDLALLGEQLKDIDDLQLDITRLRDNIRKSGSDDVNLLNQRFGSKEMLSANSFLEGKTISAANLCQDKPGLTSFLQSLGIGPDSMLTLSAGYVLAIQAEGKHIMSNGTGEINGQPVSTWAPNETVIGLQ